MPLNNFFFKRLSSTIKPPVPPPPLLRPYSGGWAVLPVVDGRGVAGPCQAMTEPPDPQSSCVFWAFTLWNKKTAALAHQGWRTAAAAMVNIPAAVETATPIGFITRKSELVMLLPAKFPPPSRSKIRSACGKVFPRRQCCQPRCASWRRRR